MGYHQRKYQFSRAAGHEMSHHGFFHDGSDYKHSISDVDFKKILEPLICQLQRYDEARRDLEQYGGDIMKFYHINNILIEEINCRNEYEVFTCSLATIKNIRTMLFDIGYFDKFTFHIDVRKHVITGMPVYYLCKTYKEYDSNYGFIIEDLYQSPGYFSPYDEFIKLMHRGHEVYYLSLSQFNKTVKKNLLLNGTKHQNRAAWNLLLKFGCNIFQDAWHEDQMVAKAASTYFDLPTFKNAIDLLYLCLSGDLCELRGKIDDQMIDFFDKVYPQKAIRTLLIFLKTLDGSDLTNLNQKARKLYIRLLKASAKFLSIEIIRGTPLVIISVQKLILGNLFRLNSTWQELKDDIDVKVGAELLEDEAKVIINELFSTKMDTIHSKGDPNQKTKKVSCTKSRKN